MNWKTIRLELAATADFPKGSVGRGFLIRAPIGEDGSIDEKSVAKTPNRAKIRRVWPNEPDEPGQLLRVDDRWVFRFNGKPDRFLDAKAKLRSGREVLVNSAGKASPFTVRIFN
jgi:hypothetical protein